MLHNLASSVLEMSHVCITLKVNGMCEIIPDLPLVVQRMLIIILLDKVLQPTKYFDFYAILYQKILRS